jgi:hypothetical protein
MNQVWNKFMFKNWETSKFPVCEYGGYYLKVDKGTLYFQANYTGNMINKTKSRKLDDFMSHDTTKNLIIEINKNIKQVCHYKLNQIDENKGHYFHERLFIWFMIWLDPVVGLRYMDFINKQLTLATLEGKTFKQLEEELEAKYKAKIEELEDELDTQKLIVSDLEGDVQFLAMEKDELEDGRDEFENNLTINLRNEFDGEIEELQDEIRDLKRENKKLKKVNHDLQCKLDVYRSDYN